jgi:hypothetical protein
VAPALAGATAVGPNQLFIGLVNGLHGQANVMMGCVGPTHPGETGHPLPGQTFEVRLTLDVPGGNTGSAANRIVAFFAPVPVAVPNGVTFKQYNVRKPIPTSLTLPCSGSGLVEFAPEPSSSTSRPDTVPVHFVPQP